MTRLAPSPGHESRTLIDALLEEQRELTAVELFARWHESPAPAPPSYRRWLPARPPGPGQQYAFEVDLDKCSGCKSCVTACHALNGLEDHEAWRHTGLLRSDDWRHPFQQTITTACHHCVDPGCLNGCPVLAYEKDPHTGIVRHLDDQCIGCQYCALKCPYEVPQYSARLGIVRKCDLCSQRLAGGEAPACAQACPGDAIRVTLVDQAAVREQYRGRPLDSASPRGNGFLPASPAPRWTLPTTRFVSARPLAEALVPANATELRLQPLHGPLVAMLLGTQLSVGLLALLPVVPEAGRMIFSLAAVACGALGLAASVLHLGRPLKAWSSFLGLRRSWLSREIVVFGAFFPLAAAAAGAFAAGRPGWANGLAGGAAFVGLLGVLCSAMVYVDTGRALWRGPQSLGRFFGTTLILGLAGAGVATAWNGGPPSWLPPLLAILTTAKLALEQRVLARVASDLADTIWPAAADFEAWSLAQSAVLTRDRLGVLARGRIAAGVLGGVILPLASWIGVGHAVALALVGGLLLLAGEAVERCLFFRTVVPPRMPGGD